MKYIEQLDTNSFYKYLEKYSNTICGRHPIGILLNVSNSHYYVMFLMNIMVLFLGSCSIVV